MVYIKLKDDYLYHIYIYFSKTGILIFKILLLWLANNGSKHKKLFATKVLPGHKILSVNTIYEI